MNTLTNMKFDDSHTMHGHVIEMTNIATRLESLGMTVDGSFLMQFILNSLSSEHGPFQMNYNMKHKWIVHVLHNMLVQEETILKNLRNHSINCVRSQRAGKKVVKKHRKGKRQLNINESSTKIQKKSGKCHFFGKYGHFQKDFIIHRAWYEKKDEHNACVCFESNLTEISHNTWWIISNVM